MTTYVQQQVDEGVNRHIRERGGLYFIMKFIKCLQPFRLNKSTRKQCAMRMHIRSALLEYSCQNKAHPKLRGFSSFRNHEQTIFRLVAQSSKTLPLFTLDILDLTLFGAYQSQSNKTVTRT